MDFNEIKNTWQKSFSNNDILDRKEIEKKLDIKKTSNIALNKVKRNFKIELYFSGLLSVFILVWLYLNVQSPNKYLIILLSFLFFGALFGFAFYNYSTIKNKMISTDQLKPALKDTIRNIERYVNFNKSNFTKYILFPFSILFGMVLGLQIGGGDKSILDIFSTISNSSLFKMILVFVIGSVLLIPMSQYFNKKMYKQHLDELKKCLEEFEEIEEQN